MLLQWLVLTVALFLCNGAMAPRRREPRPECVPCNTPTSPREAAMVESIETEIDNYFEQQRQRQLF